MLECSYGRFPLPDWLYRISRSRIVALSGKSDYYPSRELAQADGVVISERSDMLDQFHKLAHEDLGKNYTRKLIFKNVWVEFSDGHVIFCRNIRFSSLWIVHIVSVFGRFRTSSDRFGVITLRELVDGRAALVDLSKPTKARYIFLYRWLMRGEPMQQAARCLYPEIAEICASRISLPLPDDEREVLLKHTLARSVNIKNSYVLVWFLGWFLAQDWFSIILESDRLLRDRYMSLVSAFKRVGITDMYIAEYLKEKLSSDELKERINALNHVIDILKMKEVNERSLSRQIPSHVLQVLSLSTTQSQEPSYVRLQESEAFSSEEGFAGYVEEAKGDAEAQADLYDV